MKISTEKLHTVIHDIVNLGFIVHGIESQLEDEVKQINALGVKLKKLEKNLVDLRQEILISVDENNNNTDS